MYFPTYWPPKDTQSHRQYYALTAYISFIVIMCLFLYLFHFQYILLHSLYWRKVANFYSPRVGLFNASTENDCECCKETILTGGGKGLKICLTVFTHYKKSSSDGWVELQYTALALNRVVIPHNGVLFDIIILMQKKKLTRFL